MNSVFICSISRSLRTSRSTKTAPVSMPPGPRSGPADTATGTVEPSARAMSSDAVHESTTGFTKRDVTSMPSRSEEHTSELQSLMRISYAVFCLKQKTYTHTTTQHNHN